jgi:Na+-driven multidrug efflux pump
MGDLPGIRRGLRDLATATLVYTAAIVPLLWAAAPWIARSLAESPVTARYTVFALRLVPLACLLGAPFLLCRPVFEGMQRGVPGMAMAALRYGALTPAAAWLGILVAGLRGRPDLHGLLLGLLGAAAASSGIFWLWLRAALRREAGRRASAAP